MYASHVAGRERDPAPVVDVHPVRRRRGKFVPVERGVGPRDDRPRVRVRGRFAGEVPGVEFLEGGVDVVEVERDSRRDPVVGVDLDDAERLGVERLGPLIPTGGADTTESKTLPAGRNDDKRDGLGTDLGGGPHVRDFDISTVSDPDVHDPTAIVDGEVVGQYLRHRVPVAGREVRLEAVVYSACRVFQLRRRTAEFVEPRERGVEVCLVEELAAVDQVAVDRQQG